ncbi:hypothetical protein MFRU_003g05090 [Monilinia fructicola]|nr:hypothetical protein MFRU_003g05090 [Monilinia fructicola]
MQSEESTGLSNLEFTAMRLTERTLEADKFRVGMASRAWRSRCYANGRRTDVIFFSFRHRYSAASLPNFLTGWVPGRY